MLFPQRGTFQQTAYAPICTAPSACRTPTGRRTPILCNAASDSAAAVAPAAAPAASLWALKEWAPTCAAIAAGEQTVRPKLRGGPCRMPSVCGLRMRCHGRGACILSRCLAGMPVGHHVCDRLAAQVPTVHRMPASRLQILLRKGGIKEPTFKPAAREFLLFPTSFHTDAQVRRRAGSQVLDLSGWQDSRMCLQPAAGGVNCG